MAAQASQGKGWTQEMFTVKTQISWIYLPNGNTVFLRIGFHVQESESSLVASAESHCMGTMDWEKWRRV